MLTHISVDLEENLANISSFFSFFSQMEKIIWAYAQTRSKKRHTNDNMLTHIPVDLAENLANISSILLFVFANQKIFGHMLRVKVKRDPHT